MHYVKIPEPIQLKAPQSQGGGDLGDKPRDFLNWLFEVILNDPRGCEGGPVQMRRWAKVIDKFEKYGDKPGNVVMLEDNDHAKLVEIAKKPQVQHMAIVNVQLLPFFEAITEAANKDPRPKEERTNQDDESDTPKPAKRKAS